MTEPRKGYMVAGMDTDISIDVGGTEVTLPLTYAEGMIGVMPIFDTEENAKAYATEGISVFTLILHDNKEDDNGTNL